MLACGFAVPMSVGVGRIVGVGHAVGAGPGLPGKGSVMTAVLDVERAVSVVSVREWLRGGLAAAAPLSCVVSVAGAEVSAWLVVESAGAGDGGGGERRCVVIEAGQGGVVLAAGPVSAVSVGCPVVPAVPAPGWVSGLAAVVCDGARAQADRDAGRSQISEHLARLEDIVDAAHRWADENDLCERFDDFMQEWGLRPRDREFYATVRATVEIRVSVTGSTADAAAAAVGDQMIADVLEGMTNRQLYCAVSDREVIDTEQA